MQESNKYLVNIKNLADTAKQDNWAIEYDADVDSFYWTKPDISRDARLTKLSDDFALYLTPDGHVEGLFIEYAKHNFMAHNADYKPLFDNLTTVDDNRFTMPKEQEGKLKDLLSSMAHKVAAETLFSVANRHLSIEKAFV
jgi:hypothetical protein